MEEGCPICLEGLSVLSDIAITSCGHIFHTNCLITACLSASQKRTTPCCPCCRQLLGVQKEKDQRADQRQEQRQERMVYRDVTTGEIHREDDLPAIVEINGTQEWYWQGQLHREDDMPAMVSPSRKRYEWWVHGKLHRDNGMPAVVEGEDEQGIHREEWWVNGHKTRLVCSLRRRSQEHDNGYTIRWLQEEWYQYSEERHANEWHRLDGPAVLTREGHQKWYQEGQLQYIKNANGTQEWYQNGKLHRSTSSLFTTAEEDDLPAVIKANGTQIWCKNGKRHREAGPAMILADGTQKWYRQGKLHRLDGPAIINPPRQGTQSEVCLYYIGGRRVDQSAIHPIVNDDVVV